MRWWLNEEWNRLSFTWDIWYGCNYRCGYCWWEMDNLWATLAKRHKILPPEAWHECWKRIAERYGEARIDIIGGEPLYYPRWQELFTGLSRMHLLSITTNLSMPLNELESFAEGIGPSRLHISASWHPQFAQWEEFSQKVLRLTAMGFNPSVTLVAWPPFFDQMKAWRDFFWSRDISFTTQVFQGRHEGKEYPAAYTVEERAMLGLMIPKPEEVAYRLEQQTTMGKPCRAGQVYANIKGDGDIYRCGQDAFGLKPLGNLFDAEIKLNDAPKPCPYQHCSCGEFAFLKEVHDAR